MMNFIIDDNNTKFYLYKFEIHKYLKDFKYSFIVSNRNPDSEYSYQALIIDLLLTHGPSYFGVNRCYLTGSEKLSLKINKKSVWAAYHTYQNTQINFAFRNNELATYYKLIYG